MTKVKQLPDDLVVDEETSIVFLVVDGLGDIPQPDGRGTPLEEADTPNLDQLAEQNCIGLADPVAPGVTPGSPAGHLALFGYNPLEHQIGRGIVSALGINFELTTRDVAARVNFCTVNEEGVVQDRRAGRISTEENERLCQRIRENVELNGDVEFFFKTVSEHRALLVLRGEGLGGELTDTDPQETGVEPKACRGADEASERTAAYVRSFMEQVRDVLSDEERANMILSRGYDRYEPKPGMKERYGLTAKGIARYPMYLGFARLVGMDTVEQVPGSREEEFEQLRADWNDYNFFYLHIKKTDSYGEDGNFDAKKEVIEEVDEEIPAVMDLDPDVVVVTADHSTPVPMKSHSWHPVPVLMTGRHVRRDQTTSFHEQAAQQGALGQRMATDLISLALANAGRIAKFGP